MDQAALYAHNNVAIKFVRDGLPTTNEIEKSAQAYPFRGFVDCVAALGDEGFVMFTNADDIVASHYFYLGPASFEPGTLMLWAHLARRSQWVYDVGAFSGVFTLAAIAANSNCRVMAFEPSFVTYARLLVNIQANGFGGHIAPVRAGLGSTVSTGQLRHSSGIYVMGSNETFVPEKICEPWFSESVPILTLDHILKHQDALRSELLIPTRFEGADLIKIDVEGFESEVLAGMRESLEVHRPAVIVEVLDDHDKFENAEQIMARIELLRTRFGADWLVFHIDEASGTLSQQIGGRNHLFIHESKTEWLPPPS